MKHYEKITQTGKQFMSELLEMDVKDINIEFLEAFNKDQVILILSLQSIVCKLEDGSWHAAYKKRRGGKLDFDKFKREVFEKRIAKN